jgi:hypothetical protein
LPAAAPDSAMTFSVMSKRVCRRRAITTLGPARHQPGPQNAHIPRAKPPDPDPPTPDQAASLVDEAFRMDDDWETSVWLVMTTGMRRGEFCGLRFSASAWTRKPSTCAAPGSTAGRSASTGDTAASGLHPQRHAATHFVAVRYACQATTRSCIGPTGLYTVIS